MPWKKLVSNSKRVYWANPEIHRAVNVERVGNKPHGRNLWLIGEFTTQKRKATTTDRKIDGAEAYTKKDALKIATQLKKQKNRKVYT